MTTSVMMPPNKDLTMPPGFEHRATFPVPAPPERAFRALVEPTQLAKWFAETVNIEPRVGGTFTFGGRGSVGTGGAITAFDETRRELGFRWTLNDVPTEVRLRILDGDEADASKLEIEHRVLGSMAVRKAKHFVDDMWRHYHGNLRDHFEGATPVLPDLASDKPEVRVSIEINAKPAKVFRAMLDPELMNKWLFGAARVDLAKREISYGWKYNCEGTDVAGGPTRIIELVENEKLVTDWPDWRGDPEKPTTRVTWTLEPLDGGKRTRVTLVHDGFERAVDRGDYQQGWAGFADLLRKVAEELPDDAS
jgi:uncharacterized protein YndB with AHSA1/START domain